MLQASKHTATSVRLRALTPCAPCLQNQDRLMEQILQLDMSQNNIATVQALSQAADAGKANLKANDLENVEEVLDDIADQNTQMAQMQDALAMPTGMMADMDGTELDDELAVRHLAFNPFACISVSARRLETLRGQEVCLCKAQPASLHGPADVWHAHSACKSASGMHHQPHTDKRAHEDMMQERKFQRSWALFGVQEMEQMQADEELDISVPHTQVPQQAAPAHAAPAQQQPQRVAVGADGNPAAGGGGGGLPSVPTHKAQMTDEDRELEEIMKMAGQA